MDVQAQLLYRSLRPLNFAAMSEAINALIGSPEMQLQLAECRADGSVLFTNPDFHVLVTQQHEKYPEAYLANALNAPITQIKDYDFQDAIQAHRMYVSIKVGNGPVQVNDQIREWMGRMGTAAADKPYPVENKLVMLNAFVQHIVDHDTPECVHWQQSDSIFSPQEVMEARDMPFPLPLVVRPTPIIDRDATTGRELVGVRLDHSQDFIGRTLVAEPCALPFGELVGISMWLLSERIQDRLSLHHGSSLETPGFPTLYLRHEAPDASDGQGRIVITQKTPISEATIAKFNFASARWQTPRPSEQGHEHIPTHAFEAAPAPAPQPVPQPQYAAPQLVMQAAPQMAPMPQQMTPDFVSDRVEYAPAYAHAVAPAAMAPVHAPVQAPVQAPAPQPEPVMEAVQPEPAPVAEPAPVVVEPAPVAVQPEPAPAPAPVAQPAAAPAPSTGMSAFAAAAAKATGQAPRQQVATPKAQASQQLAAPEAAKALAGQEETKRKGLGNLIPMRAIASIAAVFLVVAASVTMVPKLIGGDVTVADLTPAKAASSLTILAGPSSK
jgi:hypothetical protein